MPTIAEIIAARAAAAAGKDTQPGKPQSAPVLSRNTEPTQPEPKGVPDAEAPRAPEPNRRSLGATSGELLPLAPSNADWETATWHAALNAYESELCVMRDPSDPEACWLAVRHQCGKLAPILLHRLPWLLWDHPAAPAKEDQPY